MTDLDLVIVGAGCAGLALGRSLADMPGRLPSTLLLDGRETYSNDRTWSFWASRNCQWQHHAKARWASWSIGRKGHEAATQHATHNPYVCLPAIDYYREQLARIEKRPDVRLQRGTRVGSIEWRNGRFCVETDQGRVTAKHVVDTRPPEHLEPMLWQQFSGFEVRTSGPCFATRAAGLMLDMDCDEAGFLFTYLLPFADDHALIEATRFSVSRLSREHLRSDAHRIIRRHTQGLATETVREESGCLPMGYWPGTSPARGRPVAAGAGAGALRSASGYGFLRMQAWGQFCARAIMRGGAPVSHPAEPAWRKSMDRRFLQVIKDQPSLAPILFERMANAMEGPRFARFMSDAAGPIDILAMIAALPKRPFLLPSTRKRDFYAPARV